MKIRLSLTLDVRRDGDEVPERETTLDSLIERADPPPRIGFTAPGLEPTPMEDRT